MIVVPLFFLIRIRRVLRLVLEHIERTPRRIPQVLHHVGVDMVLSKLS
jgi:hypothetical protein